jgi:hypothetical protein
LTEQDSQRVRYGGSGTDPGIEPGASPVNGREELAFPAPRSERSLGRGSSRQMSPAPAGEVALPRTAKWERGGERARSATRPKKWRGRAKPTASRVTPCHRGFRWCKRTQSGEGHRKLLLRASVEDLLLTVSDERSSRRKAPASQPERARGADRHGVSRPCGTIGVIRWRRR